MDIAFIAPGGVQGAESRLDIAAKRLAAPGDPTDKLDLSAEMMALLESRSGFAADAKVGETGEEMRKRALEIWA